MFKWLDRRKHIRRESDLQTRMKEAVEAKAQAARDALERLNQWRDDRRFHSEPVDFERRGA